MKTDCVSKRILIGAALTGGTTVAGTALVAETAQAAPAFGPPGPGFLPPCAA